MTELINDNLLKALQKEPVPYTPIWLMRQAGIALILIQRFSSPTS